MRGWEWHLIRRTAPAKGFCQLRTADGKGSPISDNNETTASSSRCTRVRRVTHVRSIDAAREFPSFIGHDARSGEA